MRIEDGKGSGKVAEVDAANRLRTSAAVLSETHRVSLDSGRAFIWTSQDIDVAAAGTMLAVRNDGKEPLIIDGFIITGGNVISRYECHIVTASFTIAGVAVANFNLNTGSANVADVTAFANESGNTQGTVIYDITAGITITVQVPTPGLVLAQGHTFAIDQVTESDAGNVTIVGHFEN